MSALQPFFFEGREVRVVRDEQGEPWFVVKDVCAVLGLTNVTEAGRSLDEDERGSEFLNTSGGRQEMLTVSESGLYALIFTSRKPEARSFRKWVTGTVLPAIRKTGRFEARPEELPIDLSDVSKLPWRFRKIRPHVRTAILNGAVQAAKMGSRGSDDVYLHFHALCELICGGTVEVVKLPRVQRNTQWKELFYEWADLFLEERPGHTVPASELYQAYCCWSREERGVEPPSQQQFGLWMGELFGSIRRSRIKYVNLCMKRAA